MYSPEVRLAGTSALLDVLCNLFTELLYSSLDRCAVRGFLLGISHTVQTAGRPVRVVCWGGEVKNGLKENCHRVFHPKICKTKVKYCGWTQRTQRRELKPFYHFRVVSPRACIQP